MPEPKKWTTEELEELKELYLVKQKSISALALWFACTYKTVKEKLESLGVPIRPAKNQHTPETRKMLYRWLDENGLEKDIKLFADEIGCARSYAMTVRRDWRRVMEKSNPHKYRAYRDLVTMADLAKLRDEIPIGTVVHLTEPTTDGSSDTYRYDAPIRNRYEATILAKYPYIVITDHGCRMWQDIYDAIKRYDKNKHLKEKYIAKHKSECD